MAKTCSSLLNTGACGDSSCTSNHDVHICNDCGVVCLDASVYANHLRGKKHQKKVNRDGGQLFCHICQVFITSRRGWFQHLVGRAHLKAATEQTTNPNITPDETETPPGYRHCDICNSTIPTAIWKSHMSGKRHHRREQFQAFRSAFEEAEKDRHGITVSYKEGVDFGIVELADARSGVQIGDLVVKNTVPSSRVRIFELKLSSALSRSRQASSFSVQVGNARNNLIAGRDTVVQVKFKQTYRGRFEDRLEIVLEDTQLNRRFIIARRLRVIVGDKAEHVLYKPITPYTPRKRTTRQVEKDVVPGVRPESMQAIPWVVPLPHANIPEQLKSSLSTGSVSSQLDRMNKSHLPRVLNSGTYGRYFASLLWIEEFQMDRDLERYDIRDAELTNHNRYYYLSVPGLAEKRPSVLQGDRIFIQPHGAPIGKWFEGFVHVVRKKEVGLCFNRSFGGHTPRQKYNVRFKLNRYPLRRQHQAMDTIFQNDKVLFPTEEHLDGITCPRTISANTFYNLRIAANAAQSQAVSSILKLPPRSPPFCVFGPPGTGKTVTIVEAIRQLLRNSRAIKILACAPSNSAADLIAERLAEGIGHDDLFRFYAPSRHTEQASDRLERYTYKTNGHFSLPSTSRIIQFRVIVSTCVSASVFHGVNIPRGHFDYIFVDEAGQATEPEVMISVKTMADNETRIVLSGDHRQLGPIIRSDVARGLGLETSYLERLMRREAYHEKRQHGISVVKLVKNFRSHEAILEFPNIKFYNGDLEACAAHRDTDRFLGTNMLVNSRFPIIFHGIVGKDDREASSPSFFNVDEILEVKSYIGILKNKYRITDHEIGVITPYHAQVLKIRASLRAVADQIKVGSTEEFQGQERPVIIMSTVRSSIEFVEYDVKHTLGFVASPRRFNVAITRAKSLLIIIGNPSVLSLDPLWRSFLNYIHINNGWTGCDISWDPMAAVDDNGSYDSEYRDASVADMNEFTRRMQDMTLEGATADADADDRANVDRPWRDVE